MYEGGWDQAASFTSFGTTAALIATDTIRGLNAGQVARFSVGDYIYDPVGQIPLRTMIVAKPTPTSIPASDKTLRLPEAVHSISSRGQISSCSCVSVVLSSQPRCEQDLRGSPSDPRGIYAK